MIILEDKLKQEDLIIIIKIEWITREAKDIEAMINTKKIKKIKERIEIEICIKTIQVDICRIEVRENPKEKTDITNMMIDYRTINLFKFEVDNPKHILS